MMDQSGQKDVVAVPRPWVCLLVYYAHSQLSVIRTQETTYIRKHCPRKSLASSDMFSGIAGALCNPI